MQQSSQYFVIVNSKLHCYNCNIMKNTLMPRIYVMKSSPLICNDEAFSDRKEWRSAHAY